MTDRDPMLHVLEDIRDTQKRHFELYQEAVQNQERSIQAQEEAIRYQKASMRRVQMIALPLIAIVLALMFWVMRMLP